MEKYFIKSAIIKTVFVLAATAACLVALYEVSYRDVHITCDCRESEIHSFVSDTDRILSKAGIDITENDIVEREDDHRDIFLNIFKAHKITIEDDGESETYLVAGTVSDALKKAKIKLNKKDSISAPESTIITNDFKVVIDRSFEVSIKVDGTKIYSDVTNGTVQSLLQGSGIKLGKNDKVNYPLTKELKKGMKIVIKRIKYKTVEETEEIPFEVETEYSDSLYTDESFVKFEGEKGIEKTYYLEKYVDGKLKKRIVVARITEKEASNEVRVKGTKLRVVSVDPGRTTISELTPPFEIELDENGRPKHYREVITGSATAYYGGTTTSTGARAIPGRVAVDPREIPYGTKMYIVSTDGRFVYGYSVAADTGGFIYNSNTVVDLRFNTREECVRFGRRNVEIYILE